MTAGGAARWRNSCTAEMGSRTAIKRTRVSTGQYPMACARCLEERLVCTPGRDQTRGRTFEFSGYAMRRGSRAPRRVQRRARRSVHLAVQQAHGVPPVPQEGCVPPHRLVLGELYPALVGGVWPFPPQKTAPRKGEHARRAALPPHGSSRGLPRSPLVGKSTSVYAIESPWECLATPSALFWQRLRAYRLRGASSIPKLPSQGQGHGGEAVSSSASTGKACSVDSAPLR